jgi:hypothetical protein
LFSDRTNSILSRALSSSAIREKRSLAWGTARMAHLTIRVLDARGGKDFSISGQ